MNKKLFLIAIAVVLTVSAFAYVAMKALDPINQYYQDGKIVLNSGQFSQTLLNYLQKGPTGYDTSHYQMVGDGYPTAQLKSNNFKMPNTQATIWSFSPSELWSIFSSYVTSAVDIFVHYFNPFTYLTFNASAVGCSGTGNCYWKSASSGNWSNTGYWFTATNGGGTSGSIPGSTDAVWFDINSCGAAYTISLTTYIQITTFSNVNANCTIDTTAANHYAFTVTRFTLGPGVFLAQSSTITVSGNWNTSAGTFTRGTSTVIFSVNATITTPLPCNTNSLPYDDFHNLTSNSGVTITLAGSFDVWNTLNIANNSTWIGGCSVAINAPPIFGTEITTNFNIFLTYNEVGTFSGGTFISIGFPDVVTLTGPVTATGNSYITSNGITYSIVLNQMTLTTAGFDITVQGSRGLRLNSGAHMVSSTSTISSTSVSIEDTLSDITATSGFWTVTGTWTNSSTSASWNFGTSVMNFNMTSPFTYIPNNSVDEFYTLNLNNTTYTLSTNNLSLSGTLNINSTLIFTGLQISFKILNISINGHLKYGAIIANRLKMTTDIYPLTLKNFIKYNTGSAINTDIEFTINSAAGAELTFIFWIPTAKYNIERNGSVLETEKAYNDIGLTFVHIGGWSSSDTMIIQYVAAFNPLIDDMIQYLIFFFFLIAMVGLFFLGYVIHSRRRR